MSVDILSLPPGALTGGPATEDGIDACYDQLLNHDLPLPPEDYSAALRMADGWAWNGIVFFGTGPLFVPAPRAEFPSLIDANLPPLAPGRLGRHLLLGRMDEVLYGWDASAGSYVEIDGDDGMVLARHATLKDLLAAIFGAS